MKKIVIISILLLWVITLSVDAGPFLDLDVGGITRLENDLRDEQTNTTWLTNDNPMGIVRLGYQTRSWRMSKYVGVSGMGYWQHISSIRGEDNGFDLFAVGIRLEMK